jgi:hypothetical protein
VLVPLTVSTKGVGVCAATTDAHASSAKATTALRHHCCSTPCFGREHREDATKTGYNTARQCWRAERKSGALAAARTCSCFARAARASKKPSEQRCRPAAGMHAHLARQTVQIAALDFSSTHLRAAEVCTAAHVSALVCHDPLVSRAVRPANRLPSQRGAAVFHFVFDAF